jgi:hypothetical protein
VAELVLVRRMPSPLGLIIALTLLPFVCSASEETQIKAAMAQAQHPKGDFKAALDYRMAGLNILGERLDRALGTCTKDRKIPLSFDIVVFISASGSVDHILFAPKSAFGACVTREFKSLRFPPPKYSPCVLPLKLTKS